MKKMKKLLTAILSTAMIFSLGAIPAFATNADNDDTNTKILVDNAISFDKYYISSSGSIFPDAEFTFTMTPVEITGNPKTENGLPIKSGIALSDDNSSVTLQFNSDNSEISQTTVDVKGEDNSTVTLSAEKLTGSFSLDGIDWGTEPAVYRYTVTEDEGDNTAIDYDGTDFTVDIYVDNTGTPIYALCGDVDESTQLMTNTEADKKLLQFKNKTTVDSLEIKKEVSGSLASKTDQFSFKPNIPVEGDNINLKAGDTFKATFTRKANSTAANTKEMTIIVGTPAEFTLADGEYIEITGVPEGMIYTVEEIGATDYTTTIKGETSSTDGDASKKVSGKTFDATASGKNMPIVDGGNIVTFTNEKDITPTGLALEFGPYLAILGVAVAGAVIVFASRKRRTER
jgi:hypothetical protein